MAFNKLAARLARLNAWTVIPATLAVATIVVSCEHPVTDPGSSIAQLVVSPQNVTLQQNQAEDFLAVGFTATGDSAEIAVSWSATGGSIDSSSAGKRHYGHYTSATCGTFTVTATSHPGNVSMAASVTVTGCPLPVASVSVTPATATIGVGQTAQYAAITRDAFGNPLGGRTVTWSSSNPGVATVNGAGQATGVAVGAATLTATSEGKSGTAAILVTNVPVASVAVSPASASVQVGQTVQLAATPRDANGNPLSGRAVSWASSNTAVATVSGSGLVTGVTAGSATITATSEGQGGTATITVSTVPVASVTVSPATASVQAGQTVQLAATPKDANGNPLSGRTVTWASSNSAVATVGGSGLVTGVTAGSATITATSEGKSGTSAITVTAPAPAPVASVTVTPAPASVPTGQTVQLTATLKDANGNTLTGRTVAWASNNTAVATVTGSGMVSGVTAGTASIAATSETVTGTSALTVTAAAASYVLVGAGDIADCDASATAALLDNIPGTVFTAGDNAYPNGSSADYTQCYDPSWGRHKVRTRPSPGNHDHNTSGAAGYFGYFGAQAGPAGLGYYSYDVGAWHIISLDSNIDMSAGSAQETWLRADLAASTKRCTIAYWHHPRFSSGTSHGSTGSTQPLWQALYDFGAEIVISGHDHEYERFAPQTADGTADAARGIREFVVGTGGAGLYSLGTPLPNSEVGNDNSHGVLKLTLSDGSYTWEFIPVAGDSFRDSGSGTCH
ncbi:MAG: hypothetical protein DMD55_18205 [Gemmatimonadetes bacterium]|nr:MAG: hypothetical protein DMD55_18205 [Gemmatimonadota bacterium]